MSHSDLIDTELVNDNDILHMEKFLNKDDQDLRSVFFHSGLIENNEELGAEEGPSMDECDQPQADYNGRVINNGTFNILSISLSFLIHNDFNFFQNTPPQKLYKSICFYFRK